MSVEWIVLAVNAAGVIGVGAGLILTWKRNGHDQEVREKKRDMELAERDQLLTTNQQNIIRRLDDSKSGLTAINEKLGAQQTHCAEVSSSLAQRMVTAERDIKEVKQKVNK